MHVSMRARAYAVQFVCTADSRAPVAVSTASRHRSESTGAHGDGRRS